MLNFEVKSLSNDPYRYIDIPNEFKLSQYNRFNIGTYAKNLMLKEFHRTIPVKK